MVHFEVLGKGEARKITNEPIRISQRGRWYPVVDSTVRYRLPRSMERECFRFDENVQPAPGIRVGASV